MGRFIVFVVLVGGCGPGGPGVLPGSEDASTSGTTAGASTGGTTAGESTSTGEDIPTTSPGGMDVTSDACWGAVECTPVDGGSGRPLCDSWAQDCPAGQKCVWYANDGGTDWNSVKCALIPVEPVGPGEPCVVEGNGWSGIDDCALGSYCWDVDHENRGSCRAMCTGTGREPICPMGQVCVQDDTVHVCLDPCDPLVQDCEAPGMACVPAFDAAGFVCARVAFGEPGQAHAACVAMNECAAGLACVGAGAAVECDADGPGCCEPWCDVEAVNTCPGLGQECTPWFAPGTAPAGHERVGTCSVPG